VKPKLLVIELWNVGDLALATPFLRKACDKYEVTLLAKPFAADLRERLWPPLKLVSFSAPWTAFAFRDKYRLLSWPWGRMFRLCAQLRRERFDVAVSARWDPRNDLLLRLTGARARLGFARMGSQAFLTQSLGPPPVLAHRYENWRIIGRALDLEIEPQEKVGLGTKPRGRRVMIHTGAAQPVRVWPLDRYQRLVERLRELGHDVQVVCDPEQRDWWTKRGERGVATPRTVAALLQMIDEACAFIGNDSGPGHLAAFCGVPTFTFFGPQVPEWFVPLHPEAEWIEGKACPYKPCSDYCMFATPCCLSETSVAEALPLVERFVRKHALAVQASVPAG